jgi:hypothetical protein
MPELFQNIYDKITEFDFEKIDHYPSSDEGIYILAADELVMYINDKKKSIAVSFLADTKPEVVANDILILKQIPQIKKIEIMDSFILINDDMLSGEEAFERLYNSIKSEGIREYSRNKIFESILREVDGYRC